MNLRGRVERLEREAAPFKEDPGRRARLLAAGVPEHLVPPSPTGADARRLILARAKRRLAELQGRPAPSWEEVVATTTDEEVSRVFYGGQSFEAFHRRRRWR